jgi:hypothetical protein
MCARVPKTYPRFVDDVDSLWTDGPAAELAWACALSAP